MAKNSMKPQIRFKGFTDAWEQRKLGEISEKTIEKNRERRYSETFTNSAEFGIVSQMEYFDHAISKTESIGGYYVVHPDDFVYNPRISVSAPVGPINRNKLQKIGIMSPLYTVFRAHDIHPQYLEYYFKSDVWHAYMRFNGDSGARSDRFSIKTALFFDMPIPCPSVGEQEKIGKILARVDNLITLHQRKYEKFVNIKKALLEKMFPQDGETVPRIRFKGFTDAWEQRKFGEYFEERNERSGEGELISVTINSGIKKFNELGRFDSKPEDLSKYKRVEVGDIAYNSMRMWQGASGYSPYAGILSPAYTVITPKNGISSLFFAYLIKRPPMIHLFEINSQGLTSDTWNLKFPAFSQIEASAPFSVEEQDRIADLFGILDNLITLHQRQVEKLKNIKSALLEKMFV